MLAGEIDKLKVENQRIAKAKGQENETSNETIQNLSRMV